MTDDHDVYADWSALRVFVPAAIGLVVIGLAALLGFRAFGADPELASSEIGGDLAGSDEQSNDPMVLAQRAIDAFVVGLEGGRFTGLEFAFNDATVATEEYRTVTSEIGPFSLDARPGPLTILDAANGSAPLLSTWTLEDGTVFDTEGEIDVVLIGTTWLVDWEPAILETSLDPGDVLVRERVVPPRAPILGAGGEALVDNRTVVGVGVVPRQVDDMAGLTETLGGLLQVDPGEIRSIIAPRPSDETVVVASRLAEDLAPIEAQLRSLPGVELVASTFPLPPDALQDLLR